MPALQRNSRDCSRQLKLIGRNEMCSPIAASSALVAVFAAFLPLTPAAMAQPGAGDFDNSGAVDARERANLTPDPPAWFRRGAKQK